MAGLTRIKSDGIGDDCDLDGEGTLVLDSTNNRVGIGTGSPRAKVDFGAGTGHGALNQTVSNYQAVFESPQGTGNIARNIAFAVGTNGIGAAINAVDNGGSDATGLMFATGTAGSISEKLRINSSGNVGIGTTAPTSLLHLAANAPYITFEDKDNNQDWQLQATAWFALRDQTAGEERLRIDSSGRIGIGSGSQDLSAFNANGSQDLVIYSKGTSGLNAHAGITLLGQSTSASQCSISFADGASGAQRYAGSIDYLHSSDVLNFRVAGNPAMRIDQAHRMMMGVTSAAHTYRKLQIVGKYTDGQRHGALIRYGEASSNGPVILFEKNRSNSGGTTSTQNDDTLGEIQFQGTDQGGSYRLSGMIRGVVGANPANNTTPGELRFYTTSIGTSQSVQERLRIGSDGKLMLLNSPGIDFSQIQTNNSGMTSETLDSYEEGTFTPSFTAGITSPVHSYRVGSYTKIGRVVNFAIRISVSSGTEISTQGLVIGGLPFSSIASNVGVQGGAYFIYTTNFIYGSGGPTPTLYIPPNTTTIQFYNDQGSTWHGDSGQGVVGSAMYLRGQYLTSS